MTIVFMLTVNYLASPIVLWYIYPVLILLFWPLGLYSYRYGYEKLHAIIGSLLVISFLYVVNYLHSPGIWWIFYTLFPLIWWPVTVATGKKAGTLSFAVISSFCTVIYYLVLNVSLAHPYPWAIYPAFAILWWPLVMYYVRQKKYFGLSVVGSLLIIVFFATVNVVSSPGTIWMVYPIFAVLWWPLSMYYYYFKRSYQ